MNCHRIIFSEKFSKCRVIIVIVTSLGPFLSWKLTVLIDKLSLDIAARKGKRETGKKN